MSTVTLLLVLLLLARWLGRLAASLGQLSILGEIGAGILLGPLVLDLVQPSLELGVVTDLAVLLLVISAGLELHPGELRHELRGRGAVGALLTFAGPLVAGYSLGLTTGLPPLRSAFLGLCISITALAVTIRILSGFGLLRSRVGRIATASALVHDVLAFLLIGVLLQIHDGAPEGGTPMAAFGNAAFRLVLLLSCIVGAQRLIGHWQHRQERGPAPHETPEATIRPETLFTTVLLMALALGGLTEALGFHFVIGAFFAALLMDAGRFPAHASRELEASLVSVSQGFLTPIFFACVGLRISPVTVEQFPFVLAVFATATVSKVLTGRIAGTMVGLPRREAWGLGVILNGRGIMELVMATIARDRGLIDDVLFTCLVSVGVITTAMTPTLFARCLPRPSLDETGVAGRS